ncbi:hypothetical protein FH972_022646 [Carpinus fangiana]|uniref:T6SS Phospholipase effector Tle1-like catalytic domain-containing protein n=1 Tax=Carpinus fangiana TaxID=176857 RepID=A0A5N6KT63_9ROSI|nr:hypothetical protein FH972_022646 [Carpinus fangiana]
MRSAYAKVKDQAVGTSFDTHVQGGYKFLMQYYSEGDDLYFFGFSRGAYIARFLAQMLDAVGLLSAGNEEMFRFAWKAFSQWQTRLEETDEQKKQKRETYRFLKAFRETFSRPVSRIRFMGLFDTVNSVPRFEVAWMQRSKFPYASKSSARVVRHAVSVDERRAKFRQYLISERPPKDEHPHHLHGPVHPHLDQDGYPHLHDEQPAATNGTTNGVASEKPKTHPAPQPGHLPRENSWGARFAPRERRSSRAPARSPLPHRRALSTARSASNISLNSTEIVEERAAAALLAAQHAPDAAAAAADNDNTAPQDVKEVWFPGCHADIGGGWGLQPQRGESVSLSHAPLLWILREARAAGLPCDEDALRAAGYVLDDDDDGDSSDDDTQAGEEGAFHDARAAPKIEVEGEALPASPVRERGEGAAAYRRRVLEALHAATTKGQMHDSLSFGQGTPGGGVLWWNFMEYLPFRRMDLRPDGTWAPIRWPLPCGETRDIPLHAVVHNSVLKRMEADEDYRPGNLIVGGGGRGVRKAPKEHGMGKWKVLREAGDPIGEVLVRDNLDISTKV